MGELAKTFGERLRTARRNRSLTQAQLADAAGMSEAWVRRIERGEASPSFETIEKFCQALAIGAADLFAQPQHSPEFEKLTAELLQLSPEALVWLSDHLKHLRQAPRL